jgi:hypothetical protein
MTIRTLSICFSFFSISEILNFWVSGRKHGTKIRLEHWIPGFETADRYQQLILLEQVKLHFENFAFLVVDRMAAL